MSIAATDITICSDALSLLGAEPIVSFDEDNDRARLSARHYPNSRDEMLERVPWKCARKRVALALSSQSVVFGLNSAMFALPGDCIFPWRTNLDIEEGGDGDIPWEVEGNFIVTSVSALNLHYIYRLLDTSQFDPLLAKAITYDLMEKLDRKSTRLNSSHLGISYA